MVGELRLAHRSSVLSYDNVTSREIGHRAGEGSKGMRCVKERIMQNEYKQCPCRQKAVHLGKVHRVMDDARDREIKWRE